MFMWYLRHIRARPFWNVQNSFHLALMRNFLVSLICRLRFEPEQ